MFGSNQGIYLGSTDGNRLDNILGNVDGIPLGIDIETELGCLNVSCDGYNYDTIEGILN